MKYECNFIDGPAAGVTLVLGRAVLMLRVVQNSKGEWDALDQLNDKPRKDEQIHVYRFCGQAGRPYHIRSSKKGMSGWWTHMTYEEWPNPGDEHLRTTKAWHQWCDDNKEELCKDRNVREPENPNDG